MFAKLWKRPVEAMTSFQFTIERQHGEPLQFDGLLDFESIGTSLATYRDGDPYHHLRLYRLELTGYAVVIEFHINETMKIVEAGTVSSAADVDDFFCLHAGDHFHRLTSTDNSSPVRDKELERRVLACYDRQLLDALKHLSKTDFGVNDE